LNDQPYLAAGTSLPEGTNVVLKFRSNKPLSSVVISDVESRALYASSIHEEHSFTYEIPSLESSASLEISLTDIDVVKSDRPHRVLLNAIPDAEPQVQVSLKGIGQYVTPDVMIPLAGKIVDDYGVEKAWTEVQVGEAKLFQVPLALEKGTTVGAVLDFRD